MLSDDIAWHALGNTFVQINEREREESYLVIKVRARRKPLLAR